ncbi:MAG: VanZ family protein [Bacteroidales bacterium]|nr:VanZ family protein [Bacteroidales bacterium]MDP2238085.1 VanZ family protein [Bacteroidales bacterium]
MKKFFLNQWPAILWALFVILITGLPGNYFPEVKSFWDWISPDKVVHLFIFGVFSFLVMHGSRAQYFGGRHRYVIVVALLTGIAYGGLTELLQYYVFIGRFGNFFDFYANVAGTISGVALFMLLNRKNKKKSERVL